MGQDDITWAWTFTAGLWIFAALIVVLIVAAGLSLIRTCRLTDDRPVAPGRAPRQARVLMARRSKAIAAFVVTFILALVVFGGAATLSVGLIIVGAAAAFLPHVLDTPSPTAPRRATRTLPPSLAKEQLLAVEALRRAGMDEQWIRAFVTFEPDPTPALEAKPVGDNLALLNELKAAWEAGTPTPLVPIRPGYQGWKLTKLGAGDQITLRNMQGDTIWKGEV